MMPLSSVDDIDHQAGLRLFLEDVCCDLIRFEHMGGDAVAPEAVEIQREFRLGPGVFADIRVVPPGGQIYFVEVKYGYPLHGVLGQFRRKFQLDAAGLKDASKVILVFDAERHDRWPEVERELRADLPPHVALETWSEEHVLALIQKHFGVTIGSITERDLLDVREAIDKAKGFYAFGGTALGAYEHTPIRAQLLWHFAFWHLRNLRKGDVLDPRRVLPPATYPGIVVVFADLCSFSSFVRDTRDDAVVAHALTSFYTRSRYQVIGAGGMMYQFLGDGVLALFGPPDYRPGFVSSALHVAERLLDIGDSVSSEWQRQIDRVQPSGGVHIGMAMGDIQILSLRPFSRTHIGAVSDGINMAARLSGVAAPGEIVVSNSLYNRLPPQLRARFAEIGPVEAKNVGLIKAWKLAAVAPPETCR